MTLLLSFSSFAQWRHDNYFSYPAGTNDGNVKISSLTALSYGVKWVRVYITGNGKIDDSYFPVADGASFEKTLALRYGPGTYQFQIMTSKSEMKHGQYAVEHSGTFTNTNPEEMDSIAPSCDVQSDAPEIIALAQKITEGLDTDLKKTQAIHDWVAGNIAYDVDSYFGQTYAQKNWDALTVLKSGLGICQGYSNLTAALNRAVGIRTKVIVGDAFVNNSTWTAHAWNEVKIDGRWMNQDTTWDAGGVDFNTRKFTKAVKQQYFDPKPEVFAKDHRPLSTPR